MATGSRSWANWADTRGASPSNWVAISAPMCCTADPTRPASSNSPRVFAFSNSCPIRCETISFRRSSVISVDSPAAFAFSRSRYQRTQSATGYCP